MCRSGKELGLKERFFIEKSLKAGLTHKEIADTLGVSRQCIDYEVHKGTVKQMLSDLRTFYVYSADYSDRQSRIRKSLTGRRLSYGKDSVLLKDVEASIKDGYSVYATVKRLKCEDLICVRSLYNYVRRGNMPTVTWKDMPYMKAKFRRKAPVSKMKVSYMSSIELRCPDVLERRDFGHWEGDTVYSSKDCLNALLVLTERKSRVNLNVRIKDRTQESVTSALRSLEIEAGVKTFRNIFKSITLDNGVEFRNTEELERTVYSGKCKRTKVWYAHPYSSFERGSNENQNKMIRRRIPKGDDISFYTDSDIHDITVWQNTYPRKLFDGESSYDRLVHEYNAGVLDERSFQFLKQFCS